MAVGGKRPGAGRKKGSLNKTTADVKVLAQQYGDDAIKALADIAMSPDQPAAARVSAANALLDRGFGKPTQAVELTGANGGPVQQVAMSKDEFKDIAKGIADEV